MGSFFKTGAAALDETIERHDAREAAREAERGKPRRFWLKAKGTNGWRKGDEEATIIFLDDDAPVLDEHTIKLGPKEYESYTCLLNIPGEDYCPLCEKGDRPYRAAFYPIIDRRSYTSKGNNAKTYVDQIRVLVAKPGSIKLLRTLQTKLGGSLKGQVFDVTRTGKDKPNIGDLFVPGEKLKKAQIIEILTASGVIGDGKTFSDVMFNRDKWEEYLAPLSVEDLEAIVGKNADDTDEDDAAEVDYE